MWWRVARRHRRSPLQLPRDARGARGRRVERGRWRGVRVDGRRDVRRLRRARRGDRDVQVRSGVRARVRRGRRRRGDDRRQGDVDVCVHVRVRVAAVSGAHCVLGHGAERLGRDGVRTLRLQRCLAIALQFRLGRREREVARGLDPAHLVLALLDIALRIVVYVEADKGHGDTDGLDWVHRLREPDDRDTYDRDALDEGRDRVCDGRGGGEDHERNNVLRKVHGAVRDEVVHHGVGRGMTMGGMRDMGRVRAGGEEGGQVVVDPDRDHEQEGHTRGVEEQVQLVQLVR